jgi:hypothetical protein
MQLESQVAPLLVSESLFELGGRPAAGTTRVKKERQVHQLLIVRKSGKFLPPDCSYVTLPGTEDTDEAFLRSDKCSDWNCSL